MNFKNILTGLLAAILAFASSPSYADVKPDFKYPNDVIKVALSDIQKASDNGDKQLLLDAVMKQILNLDVNVMRIGKLVNIATYFQSIE